MAALWEELLSSPEELRVWQRRGERAVHKPLLTLMLLARAQKGGSHRVRFAEIADPLTTHLQSFGPPRKRHHPEYPFWYLQSDGFWLIPDAEQLPRRRNKDQPTRKTLLHHDACGEVPKNLWRQLTHRPELTKSLARQMLDEFWPRTYHDDIIQALGLDVSPPSSATSERDRDFREVVLTAYERQCALCGYDARLGDTLFGLEAAHIKFRQSGGPDIVTNGIALCAAHHKAFDRGALTIDEDLTILVSQRLSGHCAVKRLLIRFHGTKLRAPQSAQQHPHSTFIRWHHSQVFRGPVRNR